MKKDKKTIKKKAGSGAKKKALEDLTYNVSILLKGQQIKDFGDILKEKMTQEDLKNTRLRIKDFCKFAPLA